MGRTKGPRLRRKKICESVRQQMEFYFSDANLQKDRFLKREMEQQEDRYVPLATFLTFNKIQNLATDIDVLKWAVSKSEVLELSSNKKMVRRTTPFIDRSTEEVNECTVYVECLPSTADHDWLKQIFSAHGEVTYVSLPRYKTTGDIKGFAFIEYKTKEGAEQACAANQSAETETEKAGKFPKFNKQILTINKQISASQPSAEGKQRPRRRRNTSDSSGGGGDTQDEGGLKRARESLGDPADGDQGSKMFWIDRCGRKRSKSSSVSDVETSSTGEKAASAETTRNKRKRKRSSVDPDQTDEAQEKAKKMSLSKGDSKTEILKTEQGDSKAELIQISAPTERDISETKEDTSQDLSKQSQQASVATESKEMSSPRTDVKPKVENASLESPNLGSGIKEETETQKIPSEQATDIPQETDKREQSKQECKQMPSESSEDKSEKVEESDDSLKGVIVDKSKRKRVSDCATGEDGEKEVKPKRVRINEEVDVQEPTVAVGKKRRKRRQNKDQKEKVPECKPRLKVIPKQEWLRLRKEYLSLQKDSMTALKKSLKKVSYQEESRTEMETCVEDNPAGKPFEDKSPQFEVGVIIKATSTEPMRRKELCKQLSTVGEVAYIDLKDGTTEAHVRCKTPEDAQKIIAMDQGNLSLSLLDGENETKYWEKITEDRERTMSKRTRTKKSGAKKLIERAERMIVQGVPKKHVIFDVDDDPEPV